MDFQLARNLPHWPELEKRFYKQSCILTLWLIASIEKLLAAASSDATEQVASPKAILLQVQTILVMESEEGASRLRDAQFHSSWIDMNIFQYLSIP